MQRKRSLLFSVTERNRTVICLRSRAFMLPSEPTGLDSNQTHQATPPSSLAVSLALSAEQNKMLLSSREEEADISALWWICWPRPGLAFSPGWFNYNIEALCIATGVVWKFKSSYIICLRRSPRIGDGTRKQTHTRKHTHCVMYDSSVQRLCN